MKNYRLLLLLPILLFGLQSITIENSITRVTFKVWGNCGMCKNTIEKAVNNVEGVTSAKWNVSKKMIVVKYITEKTDIDIIQKAIANVGYDTEKYKSTDEKYNRLHGCCQYDRN